MATEAVKTHIDEWYVTEGIGYYEVERVAIRSIRQTGRRQFIHRHRMDEACAKGCGFVANTE